MPVSGYGQGHLREEYQLTDINEPLFRKRNAAHNPLLNSDTKAQFSKFFDHRLKLARPVGQMPSVFHVGHPSHGPIRNVSWPLPSRNTLVLPPKTASPRAYKGKSGTNRWIAGLVGVGLTGAGVYLMVTGPNPIYRICTLCSQPPIEPPTKGAHSKLTERKLHSQLPTSNIHLRLTGQQGAGLVSILAGVGFLYYAIALD